MSNDHPTNGFPTEAEWKARKAPQTPTTRTDNPGGTMEPGSPSTRSNPESIAENRHAERMDDVWSGDRGRDADLIAELRVHAVRGGRA